MLISHQSASRLWEAAAEAGVSEPETAAIALPAGGCVFLHGNLWHGSGRNRSDQIRRSFAVSTFPVTAQFQPPGTDVGYIFGRYQRLGDHTMDESFFPILWTPEGYKTPLVREYCQDALA